MKKKFDFNINRKNCFFLIAGPCVIENEEINFQTAKKLKEITEKYSIPFIFKSSLYKANRTSHNSFSGVGYDKGLEILLIFPISTLEKIFPGNSSIFSKIFFSCGLIFIILLFILISNFFKFTKVLPI